MKMNDKLFDVLSFIGKIVLPALATLVMSVGDIWGLNYKNEISQTLIACDVFLNALLGITSANYYKAKVEEVSQQEEGV